MVFWQNGTAINMLYRRSKKQIRGFTLIELLVSITIFVVIAVLTTSTLVLLSQVNREILARKELMDNATTILESSPLMGQNLNSTGIEVDEAKFYVSRALPKTLYNNIKPNYDSQYLTVSLVLSKMVGSKKVSLPIQASITTRW